MHPAKTRPVAATTRLRRIQRLGKFMTGSMVVGGEGRSWGLGRRDGAYTPVVTQATAPDVVANGPLRASMDPQLVAMITQLYAQAQASGITTHDHFGSAILAVGADGTLDANVGDFGEWVKAAGELARTVGPRAGLAGGMLVNVEDMLGGPSAVAAGMVPPPAVVPAPRQPARAQVQAPPNPGFYAPPPVQPHGAPYAPPPVQPHGAPYLPPPARPQTYRPQPYAFRPARPGANSTWSANRVKQWGCAAIAVFIGISFLSSLARPSTTLSPVFTPFANNGGYAQCTPAPCLTVGTETLRITNVIKNNPDVTVAGLASTRHVTTMLVTISTTGSESLILSTGQFFLHDPAGNLLFPFNSATSGAICPDLASVTSTDGVTVSATLCFSAAGDPTAAVQLQWSVSSGGIAASPSVNLP